MENAMSVQETNGTKKKARSKPKTFKADALSAGLKALEELESSNVATMPVQLTARDIVEQSIEVIMRLRSKNVSLLRIYNDMRKATGMKIGYQTFAGYVCGAAKGKGLSPAKQQKEHVQVGVQENVQENVQADVQAGVQADVQENVKEDKWNCDQCSIQSIRKESSKRPGSFFWQCEICKAWYADADGAITSKKLAKS